MAREIEIEIPDQSDVIPSNILKGNKHDVQKLIDDLPPISSNYTPISMPFQPHEKLRSKPQLRSHYFRYSSPRLSFKPWPNTPILRPIWRNQKPPVFQDPWHDSTSTEIGAFVWNSLYMGLFFMPRVKDYFKFPYEGVRVMPDDQLDGL